MFMYSWVGDRTPAHVVKANYVLKAWYPKGKLKVVAWAIHKWSWTKTILLAWNQWNLHSNQVIAPLLHPVLHTGPDITTENGIVGGVSLEVWQWGVQHYWHNFAQMLCGACTIVNRTPKKFNNNEDLLVHLASCLCQCWNAVKLTLPEVHLRNYFLSRCHTHRQTDILFNA